MAKVTDYEARRRVTAEIAVSKAKVHGVSTWPFDYRGQQVQVTAKQDDRGKIRVSTQHVKNKG